MRLATLEELLAAFEREDRDRHQFMDVIRNYIETAKAVPLDARLTTRQSMILPLVAAGMCNSEIAERLGVNPSTVKHAVSDLMRKFDARSRGALVVRTLRVAS